MATAMIANAYPDKHQTANAFTLSVN